MKVGQTKMRSKSRKASVKEETRALQELQTLQRKVIAGEPVPNFEYNKVITRLRKIKRGNWRAVEVNMLVEVQSDWMPKEVKEHMLLILENSLFRRYSVKVKVASS